MKNRILVVDDEPDVNLAVKLALEQKDYKVDAFKDPLLVLQNFRKGLYDLIILDIKMPKMNGFELYQKMRMLDDKVKVCFLTASGINHEFKKKVASTTATMNSTENCFINKPIENEELIKRLKSQLE